MARLAPILILIAAAALLLLGERSGEEGPRAGGASQSVRAERVVDGDTIVVRIGGRTERVRYIGVDTPESVKPGTPVECFAKKASAYNARLVGPRGRRLRLRYDVERRDRYGRLLAYVYAGGTFVNAELVRQGYAQILTFPPNVLHAELFLRLQRHARRAQRGLWNACPAVG